MTLRVDWAIACRYAEVNTNLATIIGGGIDHMYVPALPQNVQVIVATRMVGDPQELLGQPHTVRCVAFHPHTLDEIARAEGQMNLQGPVVQQDWLASIHIPMGIIFPADAEGAYRLEVSADESDAYILPMHISTNPPPGLTPPAAPPE